MICFNSNETINLTIKCGLTVISKTNPSEINLNFGNGDTQNLVLNGYSVSYFGNYVPFNLSNPISSITNVVFLLASIEFKFTANLIGVEFYATASGKFITYVFLIKIFSFFTKKKQIHTKQN